MSSYRGAWDGGPPGAEEYGAPLPATDPWTGASYYAQYDYRGYGAPYPYTYDANYYQRPDAPYYGKYVESQTSYPPGHSSYNYQPHPQEGTSADSHNYEHKRTYRSNSRSVSPYNKRERSYSRKRESSYEGRRSHQRSRSRSIKSKRTKYSSSDRSSSRWRSYSRSPSRKDKKKGKRSMSSDASNSERSYKKSSKSHNHSTTPKNESRSRSVSRNRSKTRTPSVNRSHSKSPRLIDKRHSSKPKKHSKKESKGSDKKQRSVVTPPRKHSEETPPKGNKKSERSSITPPKSYQPSDKSTKARKHRRTSLTPPKSYARSQSSDSSNSRSRSNTPSSEKRKMSRTHSRSQSSHSSGSSRSSRLKSKRKTKKRSVSKHRSRSRSTSKSKHSARKTSKSRRRSQSRRSRDSRSRSPSSSSHSRSPDGTPSDDDRRGQFTVADRKRFWKLHKTRIEEKGKDKSPKEIKPPPGAVESTQVDDIEYGDPPEVEGPNFAELLPPVGPPLPGASTSKSKPMALPIKNDGSFLEMFKKMQEETKKAQPEEKKPEVKKPVLPFIGKRRGGRVLKTGLVKKAKAIDEQTVDNAPKDAWSLYMQEVKKYKETSCEEERKTRPLVK